MGFLEDDLDEAVRLSREEEKVKVATSPEFQEWIANRWKNQRHPNTGPMVYLGSSGGYVYENLYISALGIGGEAGEVQELLKKWIRDGKDIRNDLKLELGDLLHYLTKIAQDFDFTLEELMQANIDKLIERDMKGKG